LQVPGFDATACLVDQFNAQFFVFRVVEGNVFERFHLANGTDAFHVGVVEHGRHGVHEERFDQYE